MATNPNPTRIADATWRYWEAIKAVEPELQFGGIYADKSGYHNTRAANRLRWPGNYSYADYAADREGPDDKAAAVDSTYPSAQRGDYRNIIRDTVRLRDAAIARDPRLYVDGVPVLREFIGTVDGRVAYCYDLQVRRTMPGRDSSHLWHRHDSISRRFVNNWPALEGVASVVAGETLAAWKERKLVAVALTSAEIDAIADRVWSKRLNDDTAWPTTLVLLANIWQELSGHGPAGWPYPTWQHTKDMAAIRSALATLLGQDQADEAAIVAGVLEGLSPERIAAAIPPDLAEQVATELAARLAE